MASKRGATAQTSATIRRRGKTSAGSVGRRTTQVRPGRDKGRDVERILDAASKLLTSKGLSAFNMNAIAALATVDLPTLHSHFNDKTAVLLVLYERTMAERTRRIMDVIRQMQAGTEDETIMWFYKQIELLVSLQLEDPAHVALRRAIRAVPELNDADERTNANFTVAVSMALQSLFPLIEARRAKMVARTVVEAGTSLLEHCALHPKDAREMSREIGVMIVGYVREVIATAS